ncbi:MAG: aspartate-alanine antiporter [Muribaculaceae bacterium]|nr:aspartate-alanine antiporter [Muribaculaceae bacterium]
MDWLITFFRQNPLIPIFLTLGLGFWLGRLRYKSFSLGPIAATLVVGVIIGQMRIVIPDMVKSIFFMFFLFAIGYSVGPQFFRSLKGRGARQALFAVVEALVCAGIVLLAARLMGYNTGVATGLYVGSQTASAALGLLNDTVREMPLDEEKRRYLLEIIPACYAVTYVFGTIGSAWFLANVGPKMLGGMKRVRQEIAVIEEKLDEGGDLQPGQIMARRPVGFRAYRVEGEFFSTPRTVDEIEAHLADKGWRVFVERLRVGGEIVDPHPDTRVSAGDTVVLGGRREALVDLSDCLGPEVADPDLLTFGAEKTPVTVASQGAAGLTFGQLRRKEYMRGVVVASIKRLGLSIPLKQNTVIERGDVLTLVGLPRDVATAAREIGYADRQTDTTDMVFVGLGIALGCIVGAVTFKINGIPIGLSMSGGALVSGLFLGWLRNRRPVFGRIPSSALWLFSNLGVNMFIAIIGLTAGASVVAGLREAGWSVIVIGVICTIVGLVINILIGRRLFRFSAPETLGSVAGGRCSVASIGAITDSLQSDVPNLSFTVTYAVANISLVFSSLILLFLA